MQILCFSPFGYEGNLVNVEVDLRRGIPAVDIIGLADSAVKESRERMKTAVLNSNFTFPPERVLISLSPADLKKEGAGFDLAIALAVLFEKEKTEKNNSFCKIDSILVLGELELNGTVRPVKAIHAAASTAFANGIKYCIVPSQNADEARQVKGMNVFGAENLVSAFDALKNIENFKSYNDIEESRICFATNKNIVEINDILFPKEEFEFSEIYGQEKLIKALQIAAAGGHNLLAFGPPGCGKTLSLQQFPSLLPLLTKEESQSVTRIYSIAGILPINNSLGMNSYGIQKSPFRQPHQTASMEGMCGGGVHCNPGEISLAHNGVLFLDEAAEFKTSVLQMLRVPLETGSVTLSRAGRSTTFPADFQLLMSMNPCPCGNYGSKEKICLCSSRAVEQYWKKISAPLLDRIDLRVQVEKVNYDCSTNFTNRKSTLELRQEIAIATKIQRKRGKKNSKLSIAEANEFCKMTDEAKQILETAIINYDFSPRAIFRCTKLARTIADLKQEDVIGKDSINEAIDFRKPMNAINQFA